MEWYMLGIYSVLVIGGVSSFLNYRLQNRWYTETVDHTKRRAQRNKRSKLSSSGTIKVEERAVEVPKKRWDDDSPTIKLLSGEEVRF